MKPSEKFEGEMIGAATSSSAPRWLLQVNKVGKSFAGRMMKLFTIKTDWSLEPCHISYLAAFPEGCLKYKICNKIQLWGLVDQWKTISFLIKDESK